MRAGADAPSGFKAWCKKDGVWNLPNLISLSRVFMVPLLALTFYHPGANRNLWAAGVFAVAAFTDFVDGFLARRWGLSSALGAFLDPVADKLMVAAALVFLVCGFAGDVRGDVTLPAAISIVREVGVSALREWMAQGGQRDTVKVGWPGKCKTAAQMVGITFLLTALPPTSGWTASLFMPGLVMFWFSTFLSIYSAGLYLQAAWPALTAYEPAE